MLKIKATNCTFKNFILMHCTYAFKMSLPIVVLCIGTKTRNSTKMLKLVKKLQIKTLR